MPGCTRARFLDASCVCKLPVLPMPAVPAAEPAGQRLCQGPCEPVCHKGPQLPGFPEHHRCERQQQRGSSGPGGANAGTEVPSV
jgi:hypothetical protein